MARSSRIATSWKERDLNGDLDLPVWNAVCLWADADAVVPTSRTRLASGALLAVASVPGPFGPLALRGARSAVSPCSQRRYTESVPPTQASSRGSSSWPSRYGWALRRERPRRSVARARYALACPLLAAGFGGCMAMLAWLARRSPLGALAARRASGWPSSTRARRSWLLSVPVDRARLLARRTTPALAQGAAWVGVYGLSFWIVATNAFLAAMPRLGVAARAAGVALLAVPLAPGSEPARRSARAGRHGARRRGAARSGATRERADPGALRREPRGARRALAPRAPRAGRSRSSGPSRCTGARRRTRATRSSRALAHDLGAPLLTGAPRAPGAGRGWRNVAVLEPGDGGARGLAEKAHPVAVFERAPEGPLARALARARALVRIDRARHARRAASAAPRARQRGRVRRARLLRRELPGGCARAAAVGRGRARRDRERVRDRRLVRAPARARDAPARDRERHRDRARRQHRTVAVDRRARARRRRARRGDARFRRRTTSRSPGAPPPWVRFGDLPVVLAALATAAAASLIAPRRRVPFTELAIPSGASTT